jgi:hypothetical protein
MPPVQALLDLRLRLPRFRCRFDSDRPLHLSPRFFLQLLLLRIILFCTSSAPSAPLCHLYSFFLRLVILPNLRRTHLCPVRVLTPKDASLVRQLCALMPQCARPASVPRLELRAANGISYYSSSRASTMKMLNSLHLRRTTKSCQFRAFPAPQTPAFSILANPHFHSLRLYSFRQTGGRRALVIPIAEPVSHILLLLAPFRRRLFPFPSSLLPAFQLPTRPS